MALSDDRLDELSREMVKGRKSVNWLAAMIEAALAAVSKPLCQPIELGRDYVSHINITAAHGDPDYLKSNGMSVRHIDLRSSKPRKKKEPTP